MYIIITGNPVDGFNYTGPFKSHDDALRYAEAYFEGNVDSYWICELQPELNN